MSEVPNINKLSPSSISADVRDDRINLYYGRSRLCAKTGCWTAPYGMGDNKTIMCIIPDSYCEKLAWCDDLARTLIRKNYNKLYGADSVPPPDDDDLPYVPLVQTHDGLDFVKFPVTDRMRVFDSNGERIDDYTSCLSSQFSAFFLLDMSTITMYNGKMTWTLWPLQVKIKRYCVLPEGCLIFDTEEEAKQALDARMTAPHGDSSRGRDTDAVCTFEPDVNELLD